MRSLDEIQRAMELYFRRLDRDGVPEVARMQPSRSDSGIEGNAVVLRSGGKILARYRIKPGGLRRLA